MPLDGQEVVDERADEDGGVVEEGRLEALAEGVEKLRLRSEGGRLRLLRERSRRLVQHAQHDRAKALARRVGPERGECGGGLVRQLGAHSRHQVLPLVDHHARVEQNF